MKLLSNSRFTGPALLLLLVLNAGMLFVLLRHPKPPRNNDAVKNFLIDELKLDAGQQQQFASLVSEHRAAAEQAQRRIHECRDSLVQQLSATPANEETITRLSEEIGDQQAHLEKATMDHFSKVRAICNPSQQQKFDEVIREALHMMAPQGPPPPGKH